MFKQSDLLWYIANCNKNQKNYFLLHINSIARVLVLSYWVENTPLHFIFSGIVWIDKVRDYDKGICLPNDGYLGNRRKQGELPSV